VKDGQGRAKKGWKLGQGRKRGTRSNHPKGKTFVQTASIGVIRKENKTARRDHKIDQGRGEGGKRSRGKVVNRGNPTVDLQFEARKKKGEANKNKDPFEFTEREMGEKRGGKIRWFTKRGGRGGKKRNNVKRVRE